MNYLNKINTEYNEDNYHFEYQMRKDTKYKYLRQGKGMCFNYALKIHKLYDCEDGFEILQNDYDILTFKEARNGDIVSFHGFDDISEYSCDHFAIIKQKGNTVGDTIIESKFGRWGVYECKIKDMPNLYGDSVVFWAKRKAVTKKEKKIEINPELNNEMVLINLLEGY